MSIDISKKQSARKDKDEVAAKADGKCGSCLKAVSDQEAGVLCEICGIWYHCRCHGIGDPLYKVLSQYSTDLHWFCKVCKAGAEKLLAIVTKMQMKVERLEEEIAQVKNDISTEITKIKTKQQPELEQAVKAVGDDLKKLSDRVEQCEKKIDANGQVLQGNVNLKLSDFEKKLENIEKKDSPQWSDIVSKQVQAVQDTFDKTQHMINEQKSKEARVNNVIIYNFLETIAATGTDRKDWMSEERAECMKLFNDNMNVTVGSDDIKRMLRLGKSEPGKSRPVLVEFREKSTKNLIMETAPKLRYAADPFNRVVVCHDMTVTERNECKRLVQEAKTQEAADPSGEWIYRVRGPPGLMRIVKFRKAY